MTSFGLSQVCSTKAVRFAKVKVTESSLCSLLRLSLGLGLSFSVRRFGLRLKGEEKHCSFLVKSQIGFRR